MILCLCDLGRSDELVGLFTRAATRLKGMGESLSLILINLLTETFKI